jgi:hypothetical protein
MVPPRLQQQQQQQQKTRQNAATCHFSLIEDLLAS